MTSTGENVREIRCLQFPNLRHSPWQLQLVPDPQLLGTGPNYRHIQRVTENQGFFQIRKFFHQNTPEKKHIHLG